MNGRNDARSPINMNMTTATEKHHKKTKCQVKRQLFNDSDKHSKNNGDLFDGKIRHSFVQYVLNANVYSDLRNYI